MAKKNKSAMDYNFGDAAKDIKSLFTEKTALVTTVSKNLDDLSKQYDKENNVVSDVVDGFMNWREQTVQTNETLKKMAHYTETVNNAVTLNIPKSIKTFNKAQDASKNNKMAKTVYNSTKVGDYKEKFAGWNDVNDAGMTTAIGSIPVIGNIWNFNESLSVLLHNRGQIADDLYRSQLNPLMTEEYQAEALVMQQQGDYQSKKLKTLQMRKEFWEKELKTFNWNEGNKYYEEDRNKYNQILFDIESFKSQQGEFGSRNAPKPEQVFYDHLQTFRDTFLLSGKSQSDFDKYKTSIQTATAKITAAQPEFFHVKTVFYENLDKDFYEMERDQSSARRSLSDLIRDYAKGAGSITKPMFIMKLKEIMNTGKISSDPEVQDVGEAAERQIYFIEQAEKTKADKLAAAAKVKADRENKDRYNSLKAQNDFEIKGVELENDSLQKSLRINDLKYKGEKDLINFRITDEKIKQEILLDLESQRLEAAYNLEYEYSQKHNVLYSGMQGGFNTMWSEFIVGSRQAKNSMDAVWLSFKNSALNKVGSELSSELFLQLFKSGSGSLSQKNAKADQGSSSNWFSDALRYLPMILPFLADGGIATRPTLAMIGEAGPEAVIPLDQINSQKVIYVQPIIQGNFDVSLHKLNLKLDQNKQLMEALY